MNNINYVEAHGTIDTIIFNSKESGFGIAVLKPNDGTEAIKIAGSIGDIYKGQNVSVAGEWKTHPKFGKQLAVKTFETNQPINENGIIMYLSAGRIKGVGKATAKLLVNVFGTKTLDVIENHPNEIRKVKGIGAHKAKIIVEGCNEFRNIEQIMVWLHSYQISPVFAARIYEKYGMDAIERIKANPYSLIREIDGIAFLRADAIAKEMGIVGDNPERVYAGLIFILQEAFRIEGHMFLPKKELVSRAGKLLKLDNVDCVERILDEKIEADSMTTDSIRLYQEGPNIYLRFVARLEDELAENLNNINNVKLPILSSDRLSELNYFLDHQDIVLDKKQRDCIVKILTIGGIHIISGAAGTGKTFASTKLLNFIQEKISNVNFYIACPTGRAAQNISSMTGLPAATIHRLLKYSPIDNKFAYNQGNKLPVQFLLVDETSMLDSNIAKLLTDAIAPGTTIVFVGDPHQLPSVGAGNVLHEMIRSKVFPNYYFNKIFRQEEASDIIKAAHAILRGNLPDVSPDSKQYHFIYKKENKEVLDTIENLLSEKIPEYGYDIASDVQTLAPMRKGPIGVNNLNLIIQPIVNKTGYRIKNTKYHNGDKIIQNKNNYNMPTTVGSTDSIFNGDIGIINNNYGSDDDGVLFASKVRNKNFLYYNEHLRECDLAFCVTTHKSQGSCFPVVILPVVSGHYIMLSRNLLYTAVTRASEKIFIVGTTQALKIAIKNDKFTERYTLLHKKLTEPDLA